MYTTFAALLTRRVINNCQFDDRIDDKKDDASSFLFQAKWKENYSYVYIIYMWKTHGVGCELAVRKFSMTHQEAGALPSFTRANDSRRAVGERAYSRPGRKYNPWKLHLAFALWAWNTREVTNQLVTQTLVFPRCVVSYETSSFQRYELL